MLPWPPFRAIVLEGGFDDEGAFFFIPFSGLVSMVEIFRRRVVKLLVERELLNEEFAQASVTEYIARPPISLKKICYGPFNRSDSPEVISQTRRARLLAKLYEVDPFVGPRTHARAGPEGTDQRKCGAEVKCRDRHHRGSRRTGPILRHSGWRAEQAAVAADA